METTNDWFRATFIIYPLIAMLTGGFWMRSNIARMFAAFAVGGALWLGLYFTMPADATPVQIVIDFIFVQVTGFICFGLRGFRAWVKRSNQA
jgi:hypothetical protein